MLCETPASHLCYGPWILRKGHKRGGISHSFRPSLDIVIRTDTVTASYTLLSLSLIIINLPARQHISNRYRDHAPGIKAYQTFHRNPYSCYHKANHTMPHNPKHGTEPQEQDGSTTPQALRQPQQTQQPQHSQPDTGSGHERGHHRDSRASQRSHSGNGRLRSQSPPPDPQPGHQQGHPQGDEQRYRQRSRERPRSTERPRTTVPQGLEGQHHAPHQAQHHALHQAQHHALNQDPNLPTIPHPHQAWSVGPYSPEERQRAHAAVQEDLARSARQSRAIEADYAAMRAGGPSPGGALGDFWGAMIGWENERDQRRDQRGAEERRRANTSELGRDGHQTGHGKSHQDRDRSASPK